VDDRLSADWQFFLVERHLDEMTAIADGLGDALVNVRPDLPGANSAYQLVVHCCGMLEWWTHSVILGLRVDRDRPGEFVATGTLAQLHARVQQVKAQLREDCPGIDLGAPLRDDPSDEYAATPIGGSAWGALMHVFEELAQHHGQLELTRDAIGTKR
jgi:hypothetical protein